MKTYLYPKKKIKKKRVFFDIEIFNNTLSILILLFVIMIVGLLLWEFYGDIIKFILFKF